MRVLYLLVVFVPVLLASCTSNTPDPNSSTSAANPVPQPDQDTPLQAESTQQLNAEEIEAGWIQLFDGQSLFGWKANNDVNWTATGGVIQADSGEPGLLLTRVPFANFELRCDFRLETGGNSGIFLRTPFEPQDPSQDCYELNICDSHSAFPTGSFVGRKKVEQTIVGEATWKTYLIRADGPSISVSLDGEHVMQFTDDGTQAPQLDTGFIGLQKNAGKVEFRNVALRPLGMTSLFNGQDLTGWRKVPASQSEFTVMDSTIHVRNGPGFLETTKTWDNFVLQFEARTNGQHLNSGVFFRTMTGTEESQSNGYEFQIHNGFQDEDRSKPLDAGTGAIFRRTKARSVISNDEEWFKGTLIAFGPHFATWVNGVQVSAWTDDRPPHVNPRRGLRQEAGHISLQGHDPDTDLQFRKLQLAVFPSESPTD